MTNMMRLPTDLMIEIFSMLPAKSVGRFRTLSKQWCSILGRPDFKDLFRSRAPPRLLFAVDREGTWSFFSAPPPSSSSCVVTADFHSRFSEDVSRYGTLSYASGLFYFKSLWIPNMHPKSVVCNLVTGRYVILPDLYVWRKSIGFIGFEPIGKEFKVLTEGDPFDDERNNHEVLTLGGTGELSWRVFGVDTPNYDVAVCEGICIDGVLYYVVVLFSESHSIVRFDFSSEEFKLLADPNSTCTRLVNYKRLTNYNFDDGSFGSFGPTKTRLVNYKGKLGLIEWEYTLYTLGLYLYVLEDVEREKWSEYEYTLPENELIRDPTNVSVAGVTATGQIVLTMTMTYNVCEPYYVFYFNPKRNTLQSVEIQGLSCGRVVAFLDHVEDLNVDDVAQLKTTGVYANQVSRLSSNCSVQEKKE